MVNDAVERNEAALKEVLGAGGVVGKESCLEAYKEKKKRKVKRCMYQSKKEVNTNFGRKMNQDEWK